MLDEVHLLGSVLGLTYPLPKLGAYLRDEALVYLHQLQQLLARVLRMTLNTINDNWRQLTSSRAYARIDALVLQVYINTQSTR